MNRRDFLKLAALASLSLAVPPLRLASAQDSKGKKNVIVIVFDAFSAANISLYGYSRETTPNIARLAERAVVYHNHYAGGNFTVPGTASLLTGTLPWHHRAFRFENGVIESFIDKSIFHAFDQYYRVAYSHNPHVNRMLKQFEKDLSSYIPYEKLLLTGSGLAQSLFRNDDDIANVSWTRAFASSEGYAYSLFLSNLYKQYVDGVEASYKSTFPRGLPTTTGYDQFLLEDAIAWLSDEIVSIPQPFFGYFHFMPPHDPYATHIDFYGRFKKDGYEFIEKPVDDFVRGDISANQINEVITRQRTPEYLLAKRMEYDEYILYLDREFGKFFDYLETTGLLENSYVILTSDHGELFERGIWGHITPSLYEPVVRIPLMIFEPGATTRTDIHARTSAVDLLPTLLHLTGHAPVDWTEGLVLPPFAGSTPDAERPIHAVQAGRNDPDVPLTQATVMLIKGQYKLVYYFGYKDELKNDGEKFQLYDIQADPEELNDLSSLKPEIVKEILSEIKEKLAAADRPYA